MIEEQEAINISVKILKINPETLKSINKLVELEGRFDNNPGAAEEAILSSEATALLTIIETINLYDDVQQEGTYEVLVPMLLTLQP